MNTYWADLHNHNEIGYGAGSIERTYAIARGSLDILALSVHGFWPDPPDLDPALVAYHEKGFARVRERFVEVVRLARDSTRPDSFVSLVAFEWHSLAWGDFVILFPGDEGDLCRAGDFAELTEFARQNEAVMIPHHVAYAHGSRGLDWTALNEMDSPLVEIFSEHGNSLEREGIHSMVGHSMGGATHSQCAMEHLRRGRRFGFSAGTDNHDGHPGSHGEGLTAVLAESLSRKAVIDAIRKRHTYAVTGDRMRLSMECNGAIMGDVLAHREARTFQIEVDPLCPLESVQVLKNGSPAAIWAPVGAGNTKPDGEYLVRFEWGWDRMNCPDVTNWKINLEITDGALAKVYPCFVGGPSSEELINAFERISDTELSIQSFTSRSNPHPVSGIVVAVNGNPDTVMRCQVASVTGADAGGCEMQTSIRQLQGDDQWGAVLPRFSSPRIRIGRAYQKENLAFKYTWKDEKKPERDFYILKAQQKNGQTGWSSPLFFQE
jgi:hypothetical protein